MSVVVGIAMLIGAGLFFATTLAYLWGATRAARELDETFEIAKALGAYGAFLRIEADALGVTVEELVERDMRNAKAANNPWPGYDESAS